MISRKVEVTRYYACDGKEFAYEGLCLAYEKELQAKLESNIYEMKNKIRRLKEEMNRLRLQFSVAKCDAFDAIRVGNKVEYHDKMATYYAGKNDYNLAVFAIKKNRRTVYGMYNRAYELFGTHKHKSNLARNERRLKSSRWRQENTPDKWRTPNKIRVSKLSEV